MKFTYDGSTKINIEDPTLTDEELVWERLLHGIREERCDTILAGILAEEMQKEIDNDILADIMKIAKDLDK